MFEIGQSFLTLAGLMDKMKLANILVIDDEEDILFTLKMLLKKHVQSVFTESNPFHIPRLLRQHQPDLVLLDMNFRPGITTGEEGLEWLRKVKEIAPETHVIIITAHGDVETAVKALKQGASDFIEKPWQNEKLLATVRATLELAFSKQEIKRLKRAKATLKDQINEISGTMIGQSKEILQTMRTVEKVAKTEANVLILGENGTGKEMVARAIHDASKREAEVFVKVDVGAIPESLLESEFFGHKKGAFTDAHEDRIGRFEAAQNGTLFLDEIGNLSLASQSKFLTAIQQMVVTPVGTNDARSVNFRLICATNSSLNEMVEERKFRQDLLYRINTIEIHVPPLRDREGDIPLLANHFLKQYQQKYQVEEISIDESGMKKLEKHNWPGNVRELQHAIERALILTDSNVLTSADFSLSGNKQADSNEEVTSLNIFEMERKLILKALQVHQGNISKAAEDLGLTRAALYRRLEKFGLQ